MWFLSFFKIHVLFQFNERGCRGSDRMVVAKLNLQLPMQSVPVTTDVVGLTATQSEV
jgi:hypothetical protein